MIRIPRQNRAFAALPHDIAGNPDVSPLGKTVLLALLFWSRGKDHCWPSDRSIGNRVGRSQATIQRTLRKLQEIGLIERRKTADNPTGRVIVLTWRSMNAAYRPVAEAVTGAVADEATPTSKVTGPPTPPLIDKEDVIVRDPLKEPVQVQAERPRQAAQPIPPAPEPSRTPQDARTAIQAILRTNPPALLPKATTDASVAFPLTPAEQARLAELPGASREEVLTWIATADPILTAEARKRLRPPRPVKAAPTSTAELLLRVREDPSHVLAAVELLSREFDDRKSFGGFHARLKDAWEGRLAPEAVEQAYREATGPKVRNRGAVFMHSLRQAQI